MCSVWLSIKIADGKDVGKDHILKEVGTEGSVALTGPSIGTCGIIAFPIDTRTSTRMDHARRLLALSPYLRASARDPNSQHDHLRAPGKTIHWHELLGQNSLKKWLRTKKDFKSFRNSIRASEPLAYSTQPSPQFNFKPQSSELYLYRMS